MLQARIRLLIESYGAGVTSSKQSPWTDFRGPHKGQRDRQLAELEAESTAYVVCQALGLDTSDYSLGYIASWAGGGEQAIAGIKASGERIQKTASAILRAFEPAGLEAAA